MSKIEQEQTCETCYYEEFDGCAYPCSRCTHNKPMDDMWQPKEQEHERVDFSDNEVVKMLGSIRDYLCAGNPIWDVDTVREAMNEAITAVKESEWTLIRDKLPEKNGEYLVSYEDAVTILKFFNGKWFFLWKDDTIAHEETEPNLAWMPLPEPCKALK